jgi:hypothetical protein
MGQRDYVEQTEKVEAFFYGVQGLRNALKR